MEIDIEGLDKAEILVRLLQIPKLDSRVKALEDQLASLADLADKNMRRAHERISILEALARDALK